MGGRIVLTHSTHIEGLISVLERLAKQPGIQTITPAVIAPVKGHSPHLQLKVSVPIRGGFKLNARRGRTVQEVFLITTLDKDQLEQLITKMLDS